MKQFKITEEDRETILELINNRAMLRVKHYLHNLEEVSKEGVYNNAINNVVKEIDKQIAIQKGFLKEDFELDKAVKWRIEGYKLLKKKILEMKK